MALRTTWQCSSLGRVLFTWWARIHLAVLVERDHAERKAIGSLTPVRMRLCVILYTGLIAAILATGVAVRTATAILGAVLILACQ